MLGKERESEQGEKERQRRTFVHLRWEGRDRVLEAHMRMCRGGGDEKEMGRETDRQRRVLWWDGSRQGDCKNKPTGLPFLPGPDRSVSQLAFLKTRLTKLDSAAASLISNGPGGEASHFLR